MSKSDKRAIMAYMQYLRDHGYENVKRIKSPSDICAMKDGSEYFFEIKKTSQPNKYFGAATETEWAKAVEAPSRFKFVVVQEIANKENEFNFFEYSLDEFRAFCSIPPFKIYFNIDIDKAHPTTKEYKYEDRVVNSSRKEACDEKNNSKMSLNIKNDNKDEIFMKIHKVFNSYRE